MNNLLGRTHLPGEPRLIAIGGGGGGIGRSTFVSELARTLARRGRSVLVVDGNLEHPSQHLRLGLEVPPKLRFQGLDNGLPLDRHIIKAPHGRPSLLSYGLGRLPPDPHHHVSPGKLTAAFHATSFSEIILDLPAVSHPFWRQVFVLADLPILFATTEQHSLHALFSDTRSALLTAAAVLPEAESLQPELRALHTGLPAAPSVDELDQAFDKAGLGDLLAIARERLELNLVLSMTRESAERDQAWAIAYALDRLTSVWPRVLGSSDFQERRWFTERHEHRPTGTHEALIEGACDEIVTRLLNIASFEAEFPRVPVARRSDPWLRLGVASSEDASVGRQMYQRLWEGFRRDSPLTTRVLSPTTRTAIIHELQDTSRDLTAACAEAMASAPTLPLAALGAPAATPGDLIRDRRQEMGLSQRALSLQTKIDLPVLDAIEKFQINALPRATYLRGYLREIAISLDLDAHRLQNDYLTAVADARNPRILSHSPNSEESS